MSRRRESFREWVDRQPASDAELLPLTHITQGIVAEDIIRSGAVEPGAVDKLGGPYAYVFGDCLGI